MMINVSLRWKHTLLRWCQVSIISELSSELGWVSPGQDRPQLPRGRSHEIALKLQA